MEKTEKRQDTKKKPKNLLVILLATLTLLAIVLIGAGVLWKKFEGKISSKLLSLFLSKTAGESVDVENNGKKITVNGKQGQFSYSAEGQLPNGFPSDFPIYPGAKLSSSWTTGGEDGKGISVVWETSDSADQVMNFYKNKLSAASWKIDNEFTQEQMQTLSFEKDNVSGFVGLAKTDAKLTISVTLGFK